MLAIILKTYTCFYCNLKPGKQLKTHLRKEELCRDKFCEVLLVEKSNPSALEVIIAKIKNIKRVLFNSRNTAARQLESSQVKGISNFLKEIAVGPAILTCTDCSTSGTRRQMVVLEGNDENQDNKNVFQCTMCAKGLEVMYPVVPFLQAVSVSTVGFLGLISPENGLPNDDDPSYCTALLPTSYFSPDLFNFQREPLSQQRNIRAVYRQGIMNFEEHYSMMYEQEVKKFDDAAKHAVVVPGYITSLENRELVLTQSSIDCSRIPGVDDFHIRGRQNILHSIAQVGTLFLVTELEIPNVSLATFATQLKIDDDLRVDILFTNDDYPVPTYKVHCFHGEHDDCSEECEIVELSRFLETLTNPERYVSLATQANYTQNLITKFINSIVCDPDSPLSSDKYDANLQFPLYSSFTKAIIASWPKLFSDLNKKIANKERWSKLDLVTLSESIDTILTTSMNVSLIQENFNLDAKLAEEVHVLALEHQLQKKVDEVHQMPSQITLVKRKSTLDVQQKKEASKQYVQFITWMEARLVCLKEIELYLDVETWLINLEDEEGFYIEKIGNFVHLFLPPHTSLCIPHDNALFELMEDYGFDLFQALYHRGLTFSQISSLEIVLRCEILLDAFVKPYNPTYLLAARSPVTTRFVGGKQVAEALRMICGPEEADFMPEDPLIKFQSTHKQVKLMEALWRYDGKKSYRLSNVTPKFVNTAKTRRLKFIKAKGGAHENHFKQRNDPQWYEIFEDDLQKYYLLPPTADKMCPFDFLQWYKKMGFIDVEENEAPLEEHEAPLIAISEDDWSDQDLVLPKQIVLTNGESFVRRNMRKVLSFPIYDSEDNEKQMFTDIVLFKHSKSFDELKNLTSEQIQFIFNEKDVFPLLNGLGMPLSKIDTIKLRLNSTMCDVKYNLSDCEAEFVKIYFDF